MSSLTMRTTVWLLSKPSAARVGLVTAILGAPALRWRVKPRKDWAMAAQSAGSRASSSSCGRRS